MPDVEDSAEDLEAWNFNDSYAQTIVLIPEQYFRQSTSSCPERQECQGDVG